ncbi:MAG: class I SAM-dependent methyltransferase [Candidatus Bathyarchaeota archaeon]|nr:MAG: class I SAM-dependent methyltransferase [Candidatus Bathyarchaeota archaeon]
MKKVIWATPLYKFLRHCDDSPLEKTILDCGAGGDDPLLRLFLESGYNTTGIEISDQPLNKARKFCEEHGLKLNIFKGDMKKLPFKDEAFSFVYSYNTLPLMSKKEVKMALRQIQQVVKPDGLCFINFVSEEDEGPADSYYEDNEPDQYFTDFLILYKEKRIILIGKERKQAYIDYIVQKKQGSPK